MDKSVDKTVTRPSGNRVPTVSPTVSPEGHGATVSPCPLPSGHGTRSHVPATVSFSRDMVESGEGVIGVPELLRLDAPTEAYRCAGRPVHTARTSLADLDRSDKAVA